MKDVNVALALALTAALAALIILTGYLYTEDNAQAKPSPPVKITTSSATAEVNKFFKNANVDIVSNQIIWSLYKTELTQETVYAAANAKTENEKRNFKDNFRKQGGKIYRQVCYNLHAFDESWSLGYCVHKNL